MISTIR